MNVFWRQTIDMSLQFLGLRGCCICQRCGQIDQSYQWIAPKQHINIDQILRQVFWNLHWKVLVVREYFIKSRLSTIPTKRMSLFSLLHKLGTNLFMGIKNDHFGHGKICSQRFWVSRMIIVVMSVMFETYSCKCSKSTKWKCVSKV